MRQETLINECLTKRKAQLIFNINEFYYFAFDKDRKALIYSVAENDYVENLSQETP